MDMVGELPSLLTYDLIGPFLGSAWLLGRRTAQLHLALGSRPDDPVFRPEPITRMYQRSLYQSMRSQAVHDAPPRWATTRSDPTSKSCSLARTSSSVVTRS